MSTASSTPPATDTGPTITTSTAAPPPVPVSSGSAPPTTDAVTGMVQAAVQSELARILGSLGSSSGTPPSSSGMSAVQLMCACAPSRRSCPLGVLVRQTALTAKSENLLHRHAGRPGTPKAGRLHESDLPLSLLLLLSPLFFFLLSCFSHLSLFSSSHFFSHSSPFSFRYLSLFSVSLFSPSLSFLVLSFLSHSPLFFRASAISLFSVSLSSHPLFFSFLSHSPRLTFAQGLATAATSSLVSLHDKPTQYQWLTCPY